MEQLDRGAGQVRVEVDVHAVDIRLAAGVAGAFDCLELLLPEGRSLLLFSKFDYSHSLCVALDVRTMLDIVRFFCGWKISRPPVTPLPP